MQDFLKNKKMLALAGVSLLVVFFMGWMVLGRGATTGDPDAELIQNEEAIPTVDASVKVSLSEGKKNGDVMVEIKNAPAGTKNADIELSYERERQAYDETTENTIPDGAIASCDFKGGSKNCTKDGITLGTCSSGVCRFHKVVGPIKVTILFNGSYGKKLFEGEFEL